LPIEDVLILLEFVTFNLLDLREIQISTVWSMEAITWQILSQIWLPKGYLVLVTAIKNFLDIWNVQKVEDFDGDNNLVSHESYYSTAFVIRQDNITLFQTYR